MNVTAAVIVLFLLGSGINTAALSSHKHGMSPEMKKQHHAMATINKQWKALTHALKGGNLETAERAVGKILETAPSLENFTLHKNAEKHMQFREYHASFVESAKKLKEALKARDIDAARDLS